MSSQLELFKANLKGFPTESHLSFEQNWVEGLKLKIPPVMVDTYTRFAHGVRELISGNSSHSDDEFIADTMTLAEFRRVIREYAPDGLTEANAMFSAIPRLQGRAQTILFRILMDEFGCGKQEKIHQSMYRNLLTELEMSTRVEDYQSELNEQSYAFVNLYHWLTQRAPCIDYYLGALAYTEMSVPPAFIPYAKACERLNIKAKNYFTEHIGIDVHHTREALKAVELMHEAGEIDLSKAMVGAQLAQIVGGDAFHAAMRKARA